MKRTLLSAFLVLCFLGSTCLAETLDLQSTDLIITKLEGLVKSQIDENDIPEASSISLRLRLADLYSDRARLKEIAENYSGAKEDRQKALGHYLKGEKVLPLQSSDVNLKSKLASQIAHLHVLTGQTDKAQLKYAFIVKNKKSFNKEAVSEAHLQIGESLLSKQKLKDAEWHFNKALIDETKASYVQLKLAWCSFYKGKTQEAADSISEILSSPQASNAFKEGAAHDLATMLAQQKEIKTKDIQNLFNLSPEPIRISNLTYLAQELDRLGKKSQSLTVWHFIDLKKGIKNDFAHHLNLAQIHYDLGQKNKASTELDLFYRGWKSDGCDVKTQNCDILKAKSKKIITDWATAEDKTPTPHLINAFKHYLNTFPEEDMALWAAQTAHIAKKWTEAFELFEFTRKLATQVKSKEAALTGSVDTAEASGNKNLKEKAYSNYLSEFPHGPLAQTIKYQLAYLEYEKNQFQDASEQFHKLALEKSGSEAIKIKAADMSITSLLRIKNKARIESWGLEYSKLFPIKSEGYKKISWNAMIDRQSQTINDNDASRSDVASALDEMKTVSTSQISSKDKRVFYKNKLVAAEKVKDLPQTKLAAQSLLSTPGVTEDEKEFALSRLAWAEEMTLNFATALQAAKKLKMKELSHEQKLQKLSLLASLAGQDSSEFDSAILKKSKNKALRLGIIEKRIRSTKNKKSEFNKFAKELSQNPKLFADLALEVFAETRDTSFARNILKSKGVRTTDSGHTLARYLFLENLEKTKMAVGKIQKLSEPLKKSLSKNLKNLDLLQNVAQKAINDGDTTEQIVALSTVEKWNNALAEEIAKLPVPSQLKALEKRRYRELLSEQARPYKARAAELSKKLDELWNSIDFGKMERDQENLSASLKDLLHDEMQLLSVYARKNQQRSKIQDLKDILTSRKNNTSKILAQAEEEVRAEPFNEDKVSELRKIEAKAGRPIHVSYLDERLLQIKRGGK